MTNTKATVLRLIVILLGIRAGLAAQQPKTTEAFNQYLAIAEARIDQARNSAFLDFNSLPAPDRSEMIARLQRGEVVIRKPGNIPQQIPDGLIHDWTGIVFFPNATLHQVLAVVRDYDHAATYYSPDVLQSRLISENGNDFRVFMRLRQHKVVTLVLDAEYEIRYGQIDAAHQYSVSRSTRTSEIAEPGTANERVLAPGQDHGFMWRLNTYWAFEQAQDGVFVQCEAISLTRDIPTGLAWMIAPFVNSIPRESLEFMLNATRTAIHDQRLVTRH